MILSFKSLLQNKEVAKQDHKKSAVLLQSVGHQTERADDPSLYKAMKGKNRVYNSFVFKPRDCSRRGRTEEQIGPRVGLLVQRLPCLIQCETGEEKSKNPRRARRPQWVVRAVGGQHWESRV